MAPKKQIEKWIEGSLTPEELEKFETSEEFKKISSAIEEARNYRAPHLDVEASYTRLKKKLPIEGKDADKTIQINWKAIRAVAASAALIVVAALTIIFAPDKVRTINGPATAYLPDSTEVILHQATSISYRDENWKNNRQIDLKGEAYFDVKKGSKFTVETRYGNVAVLGTEFNVKSREYEFRVACFEGKVNVSTSNSEKILTAGQAILKNEAGLIAMDTHSKDKPEWINGYTSFSSESLELVMAEIEILYQVKIESNNLNKLTAFTGKIPNDDLQRALDIIAVSTNSQYKIEGDRVTINGSKAN